MTASAHSPSSKMDNTQLISRNGHPFNSFSELSKSLAPHSAGKTVLDGEIVCLDKRGRPQFRDLLFHRGEPCFYAFDLLMYDGKDMRSERLTDRKHELRRWFQRVCTSVRHAARLPWLSALTADLRSALAAVRSAAESRSVISAMTTTSRIHA